MKKSPSLRLLLLVLGTCAAAALAGCSPESTKARRLERAQSYFARGDRADAEVEYLNVLRTDQKNAEALARLGQIYFEQGRQLRAAPYLALARTAAPQDFDSRRRFGLLLLAAGKPAEARAESLTVLDAVPNDPEALLLLAETSTTPDQVRTARDRLASTASTPTGEAARLTALGVLDMRERNLPVAEERMRQAVTLAPESDLAQATLAALLAAKGDLSGAGAAYSRAAELSPARSPRRVLAAQFLLRTGDVAAAKKLLDATLAEAADYLPAATWRAEVALLEKDYAAVDRLVTAVLAIDGTFADAQALAARLRLAQGEFEQAEASLRKLVETYPQSPQLHYYLALAQNAGPDNSAAVGSLTRALALDPGYVDAALLLASINTRRGDPASAAVAMQQLTKKNPRIAEAWLLLVDAYQRQGDVNAALQTLGEARQRFPERAQIPTMIGILLKQQGHLVEAGAAFAEALQVSPGFSLAMEQLITLDLDARRFDQAAQRAQDYAAVFPDQPEPHLLTAKVAFARGERAAAESALRKVIAIRPDHSMAYLQLARLFIDSGRSDEALRELEQAAQHDPRDVSLQMLLGTLLQQRGDISRARTAYEQAIKYQPRFVAALNNLAYIYSETDHDYDRAYAIVDRARKLAPYDPFVQDTFGWVLHQKGQFTWAKGLLLESAAKLPDQPEVQMHLGLTHYMLAEEAEARAALQTYLASGITGPVADDMRQCIALLESDPHTAIEATRALVKERQQRRANDPVAALRQAALFEQEGAFAEAQATYEGILKAFPQHLRLRTEFARYLQRRGDLASAYAQVKGTIQDAPDDLATARITGRLAYLTGDFVPAANLLRDCAHRLPADGDLQQDFADALFAIGELSAAETAMRAALAAGVSPDRIESAARQKTLLAFLLADASVPVPADVPTAIAADPKAPTALLAAVVLHHREGDAAAAVKAGEELLARFPDCPPAALRLAAVTLDLPGKDGRTFELAQKVRAQQPTNPEAARLLGVLAFRKGDFARATTLLGESTGKIENDARVWYYLGSAFHHLGKPAESRAALQRAVALGLTGEDASEARRLLADNPRAP